MICASIRTQTHKNSFTLSGPEHFCLSTYNYCHVFLEYVGLCQLHLHTCVWDCLGYVVEVFNDPKVWTKSKMQLEIKLSKHSMHSLILKKKDTPCSRIIRTDPELEVREEKKKKKSINTCHFSRTSQFIFQSSHIRTITVPLDPLGY